MNTVNVHDIFVWKSFYESYTIHKHTPEDFVFLKNEEDIASSPDNRLILEIGFQNYKIMNAILNHLVYGFVKAVLGH